MLLAALLVLRRLPQAGGAAVSAADGARSCWRRCAGAPTHLKTLRATAKIDHFANGGERAQASR